MLAGGNTAAKGCAIKRFKFILFGDISIGLKLRIVANYKLNFWQIE